MQLEFGILAVLGLLSLLQWFWLCLIHCLVSFFRSPADLNSPEIGGEFCLQFEGADPDVSFHDSDPITAVLPFIMVHSGPWFGSLFLRKCVDGSSSCFPLA